MSNIIEEKHIISKHIHTSVRDVDELETAERRQLLKLIIDDLQRQHDAIERAKEGRH